MEITHGATGCRRMIQIFDEQQIVALFAADQLIDVMMGKQNA
jgi:hypothetical protein